MYNFVISGGKKNQLRRSKSIYSPKKMTKNRGIIFRGLCFVLEKQVPAQFWKMFFFSVFFSSLFIFCQTNWPRFVKSRSSKERYKQFFFLVHCQNQDHYDCTSFPPHPAAEVSRRSKSRFNMIFFSLLLLLLLLFSTPSSFFLCLSLPQIHPT